jgi:hypothetical protein
VVEDELHDLGQVRPEDVGVGLADGREVSVIDRPGLSPRYSDSAWSRTSFMRPTVFSNLAGSPAWGMKRKIAETKSPVASKTRSTPSTGSPW